MFTYSLPEGGRRLRLLVAVAALRGPVGEPGSLGIRGPKKRRSNFRGGL